MAEIHTMQLGPSEATKALNDESFLKVFPEFRSIKAKQKAFQSGVHTGCATCRKKTIAANVTGDFLGVLSVLPEDRIKELKGYFKTDRLMYTRYDARKGSYKTVVS